MLTVIHPVLFIAGGVLDLAGIIGIILTHFGLVTGFLVISPILFAAGITTWLAGAGLSHPVAVIAIFGIAAIFLEGVVYFNFLGLGGVL